MAMIRGQSDSKPLQQIFDRQFLNKAVTAGRKMVLHLTAEVTAFLNVSSV